MNNIIFKTTLIKGAQGAKGDPGEGDSIPTKSVIAYEGQEIPEGYIRTDAPAEFQALETRLNNIIAHPVDGETTAEELVDVRVSAYGDTYGSAGDAVRGQVDILQEQIDRLLDNTIQGSGEGEIVSYENGSDILPMKSAKVYLNPKQDLHGYDFPWVGGAGKNKVDISDKTLTQEGYVFNESVSFPSGIYTFSFETTTENVVLSFAAAGNGNTYANGGVTKDGNRCYRSFTATDVLENIRLYSSGAGTFTKFQLEIEPTGAYPSEYEPYENICPISGYEGVGLDISNSNLWDETVLEGLWNNGERLEVANRICSNYIYVKGLNGEGQTPNGVRWVSSQNTPDFSAYDENKNYLYNLPYTEDTDGIWVPIPEAAYYVTFNFNNSYGGTYLNDTALLRPITKTEYVAHEGKEYNVQIKNRNLLQLTLENIMNLNSDWDWTLEDGVLTCDKGEDAYKWEIYFKTNGLIRIHAIAQGTPGYDELFLPIPEGGYPSGTYYAKYTGGSDLLKVYIDVGQNVIVDEYEIIENQIRAASVVVSGLDSLLDDVCICKDREDLNLPIYIKGAPDDVTLGGWVDIATGELAITKVKDVLKNLAKVDFTNGVYSTCYRAHLSSTSSAVSISQTHGAISNMGTEQVSYWGAPRVNEDYSANSPFFAISTTGEFLAVYDNSTTITESDFLTKYGDLEACYPLAEPITYQLTKQEVLALLGANNVYSKDGSVAVIYRQDTNLVIQDILNRLGA